MALFHTTAALLYSVARLFSVFDSGHKSCSGRGKRPEQTSTQNNNASERVSENEDKVSIQRENKNSAREGGWVHRYSVERF